MCRLYRWLYAVLPLPALRARLIARHLGVCPACAGRLAGEAALRSRLSPFPWPDGGPDLWPAVSREIDRLRTGSRGSTARPDRFLVWRWATVPVMVAMLALPLWRMLHRPAAPAAQGKAAPARTAAFALLSATIDGQPATPCVIEEPESGLVIVWLEKN